MLIFVKSGLTLFFSAFGFFKAFDYLPSFTAFVFCFSSSDSNSFTVADAGLFCSFATFVGDAISIESLIS
jgi:hypothetical protein